MTLHGLLRLLLARRLREEHGEEMERVFREAVRKARAQSGLRGVAAVWIRETVDVVTTAVASRVGRRRSRVDRVRARPAEVHGHRDFRERRAGGMGGMGRLIDDAGHALRSLGRSPGYALFAVGTLALGIGAATTLFSAVDRVVFRPADLPHLDRTVVVWRSQGPLMVSPTVETLRTLEELDGVFETLALSRHQGIVLSSDRGAVPLSGAQVDAGLFELMGVERPVLGRLFAEEEFLGEGSTRVALSEELWRGRFGADPDIIGRRLQLDGEPHTVVGVLPAGLARPNMLSGQTDLWLPLGNSSTGAGFEISGRLVEGITLEAARERIAALQPVDAEEASWTPVIYPVGRLETTQFMSPLKTLGGAVALLLLLACVSVASLLLARADTRSLETSVRSALGADRGRLVRESLVESILLSGLGAVGGIALAHLAIFGLVRLRPEELRLLDGLSIDPRILAATLVTSVVTMILFGVGPALRRGRQEPGQMLGDRGGTSGRDSVRLRRGLLVFEIALSFTLLVGATQLLGTLGQLQARDPGFDAEGLIDLRVQLPEWRFPDTEAQEATLRSLTERIEALPGVSAVTRGNGVPPQTGIYFGSPEVEGVARESSESEIFFGNSVIPGYFRTLDQPVLAGRTFTEEDLVQGADVILMGRSTAERFFPDGDAVGGRFRISGEAWHTVIGVVEDVVAQASASQPEHGQLYFPADEGGSRTLVIRVDRPEALFPQLRSVVAETNADVPVNTLSLVSDRYRAGLAKERLLAFLLSAFALSAGLLASIGLYGVASQVARRRTREFGIRMSLGAERGSIFATVLGSAAVTIGAGLATGVAMTLVGLRLLRSGVAGLESADPLAYLVAGVLLAGVTLLATSAPARRAARIDPVEALRSE